MKIGLIADTHGLLRPEVAELFADVQHIIHGGDIGPPSLLRDLQKIAPVSAVWGNVDGAELRELLPEVAELELDGATVVVVHGHQFGSPTANDVAAAHGDADLVVFGHSHQAGISRIGASVVVNPGSAGPRRFRTRPTVAVAHLVRGATTAEIVPLRGTTAHT